MSARGGKAVQRRKANALVRATGRTGSHRNSGKGFHRIGIAEREHPQLAQPITVAKTAATGPVCDKDHPMHLEVGPTHNGQRSMFWVCNRLRCRQAIAYKPLRTGLKQTA